jgi:4-amino-4-deoxy-L-arabinose transferase-like glycosyltransferase
MRAHAAASPTAAPQVLGGMAPRTQVLLLAALIVLLYLPLLGAAPLIDVDEGAFSEATRNMLASGDWMSTTLNGVPRFDKPILIYWLQAISVTLFGVNEFAFRLPSALAALGWCFVVGRFAATYARHSFASARDQAGNLRGELPSGLLAAWIAATALGVLIIGRAATADALLNLLLACAMADLWRYLATDDKRALWRLYFWVGLGVLTKGPIAIVIPAAAAVLYALTSGMLVRVVRAGFNPVGWAIFIAVVLPWYAYAFAVHGQDFWNGFFVRHNLNRFGGTLEGHSGSLFYYVLVLPLIVLPWTGVLIVALRHIGSDFQQPVRRFLWLWSLFVLGFFSLSGTKLPHYVLYGTTPLIVLLAWHAPTLKRWSWALIVPTLMLAVLPALPHIVDLAADRLPQRDFYAIQMSEALPLAGRSYFVIAVGALAVWAALLAASARSSLSGVQRLALGAGLTTVVLVGAVSPWVGELLAGPVKRAGLKAHGLPDTVVQWSFHVPSFSVYRQQPTPARPPQPGDLAITRADRLPADAPVEILYRERGVVLLRYLGK